MHPDRPGPISPSGWSREHRFEIGEVELSSNCRALLQQQLQQADTSVREYVTELLTRHVHGDWGMLDELDWAANSRALNEGRSLISAYETPGGDTVLICTEADRHRTLVQVRITD